MLEAARGDLFEGIDSHFSQPRGPSCYPYLLSHHNILEIMNEQQAGGPDPAMDTANLYRETSYTDQRVGSIRVLTPVTAAGEDDPARPTLYIGQASIYTPAGTLPIQFELAAATLAEAVTAFGPAAQQAMDETIRQLQELRRDAASSIVLPGNDASKIQLR